MMIRKFQLIACCALVALSCCQPCRAVPCNPGYACLSFRAATSEEAAAKALTVEARTAFAIELPSGELTTPLYTDPFPIAEWGTSAFPIPGLNPDHKSGLMQRFDRHDLPADWFITAPHDVPIHMWWILTSPELGTVEQYAGYNFVYAAKLLEINVYYGWYLFQNYGPPTWQVVYGSNVSFLAPEPATVAMLLPLALFAVRRRRR